MDEINPNVYGVINLSIALGIALQTSLRLSSVSVRNKFIKYTSVVLVIQIVYCILFINSRAKQANNVQNQTISLIEDIAPLLFCFIFPAISWLLMLRARAMFPDHIAEWKIAYPIGLTFIVIMFLVRLTRVVIRFIASSSTNPATVSTLSTIAVQLNNIAIIPVNIFQCLMDGLFLYQFVFKLRGGKSIFQFKLTKKSSMMFNGIMAEFAVAILNVIIAIISYLSVNSNLFNFLTAVLASLQINNLVEFGTDVREFMEDLKESGFAHSQEKTSAHEMTNRGSSQNYSSSSASAQTAVYAGPNYAQALPSYGVASYPTNGKNNAQVFDGRPKHMMPAYSGSYPYAGN